MEAEKNQLGEWLRRWRKQKGLTQEELAAIVKVTKSHISNIERGQSHPLSSAQSRPSLKVLDRIAEALERPIAEARELAGYGLATETTFPVPANAAPMPAGIEELLLYYFRALPAERRPDALAIMARLYQDSIRLSAQQQIDESEIGQEIEIIGRIGQG